jgi:hypothetical protein
LDRKEKLRQHFFAWRLGLLVRGGNLIRVGSGPQVLNKVALFAGIDPDLRRNAITAWNARFPDSPWTMEGFGPGWGDEAVLRWETLMEDQWTRAETLFGKDRAVIEAWLKEGRKALAGQLHLIRQQVRKIEDAISTGPEQQGNRAGRNETQASTPEHEVLPDGAAQRGGGSCGLGRVTEGS